MNAKDAWLATLGQLQVQLNRSTYDTWLRRAELLGYEDGRFVVTVPNAYARDWIERHLLAAMNQTISSIFQRECEIQVIVWNPAAERKASTDADAPLFAYPTEAEPLDAPRGQQLGETLNPAYTLDLFITGESNRYAALLAQAICDSPLGRYSPVYFCGGIGMGKTHLLQGIAHALCERGNTVIYLSAEQFTNELVTAIREHTGAAFREKFRTADVVLIDDLQFVEGKESTQNELIALWDALRNRQRVMIFAADRLPRDMSRLLSDARSRFQAGPIAYLEPPDPDLRRAILEAKAARRGLYLPPAVRDMLAARITTNVRDLESAIEQLESYSGLTGQAVGPTAAQRILQTLGSPAGEGASGGLTLERLFETIAAHYQVTPEDLASRKRTRVVAQARQVAMYLAREHTESSLPQIGDALGGRDHSTVAHGCARIAELLASDAEVIRDVAAICTALGIVSHVVSQAASQAVQPAPALRWLEVVRVPAR